MNIPHRTTSLYRGLAIMKKPELMPFDDYFVTMAEADHALGRAGINAVKSYHIRENPFNGPYAILGGLTAAILQIQRTRFDDPLFIRRMKEIGHSDSFIRRLARQRQLRIRLYAPQEGTLFFPHEPIVTAEGPLADIRLVEGILTRELNFASLSLTKWHRIVRAASPSHVLEFGRRRAQNSQDSTLYAMLAGCDFTSNDNITEAFDFPVAGTMGHEWVQSVGDVRKAFELWLQANPSKPLALVDTVNTMKVDYPAWLDAVHENRSRILDARPKTWGWRNDSGDLADITVRQYRAFLRHPLAKTAWFRENMRIVLTGDLDEYSIPRIRASIAKKAEGADIEPADITAKLVWGAGTRPATCHDQPSIGGVMKIAEVDGRPSMKLALNGSNRAGSKTSMPGFNFSESIIDNEGRLTAVLVSPARKTGTACRTGRIQAYDIDAARHTIDLANKKQATRQRLVYDTINHNGPTPQWKSPDISQVPKYIRQQTHALATGHHPVMVLFDPTIHRARSQMIKNNAQ